MDEVSQMTDDKKFWEACVWSWTHQIQGRGLLDSVEAPLEARGRGACFPRGNPLLRAAEWVGTTMRSQTHLGVGILSESWPKKRKMEIGELGKV